MTLDDLDFLPQGTPGPHLLEFYQRNGLNLFFSSLEQEMQYRNWDVEKDGPLETRLMFRDMILLKRPSIR